MTDSPDGSAVRARVFGRFATADRSGVGRLELSGNAGKLGFFAGVSLKGFGDLRAGEGTGLQPHTGYDERDGDLNLSYRLSARQNLTLAIQQVRQEEVPRTDRLAAGSDLQYEWAPQRRQLAKLQYTIERAASFVDSLKVGVTYQNQLEQLNRISAGAPDTESRQRDEVQSAGLTVQLSTALGERQLLTYGADLFSDRVFSRRVDVDRFSGSTAAKPGAFADGAKYRSIGVFLQDEIRITNPFSLVLGARYSRFDMHATTSELETGLVPISLHPRAFTGSAFGLYKFNKRLGLFFGAAQGFRAPNVDDVTILGSFGGGFEVPNSNLQPEKSLNYELGIKSQSLRWTSTVSYFISNYRDLIQRTRGLYLDLPFLDLNNDGIQGPGEDLVFQRTNMGEARIQGLEVEARVQLHEAWTASGGLTWVRGTDTVTLDPLRRIPPVNGIMALRWVAIGKAWIEGYSLFASQQDRLAPGDRTDPRIPAGGTPGFLTLNVRGGVDWHPRVRFTLGLENITNRRYRYHGSGIDAPGINLVVGCEWSF